MIRGIVAVYPETGFSKAEDMEWGQFYYRWVRLLDSHPKIKMEFAGLSDKEDFSFLAKYDFVYLYLHPKDKGEDKYWWWDVPYAVRKYSRKLILQFDYEGIMKELPPFIQTMICANADALLFYSDKIAEEWDVCCPKYVSIMISTVEELGLRIFTNNLKSEEREQSIGVLWHSASGASIDYSLQVCSRLPYKVKVFTSWLGMNQDFMDDHVQQFFRKPETYGSKGMWFKCYPFMEYNDYLRELSKCWVVLEDNQNYYGFSRLAYECSTLRIPVVGSTNNTACNIAYPLTTTNPQNLQLQTQLIKRLFTDQTFYKHVQRVAYSLMRKYLSNETQLNRFTQILKDLKVM